MSYEQIAEKYDSLLRSMADSGLMQRVINNSFKREFEILNEYESKNSPCDIISHDAFGLHDINTGKIKKYAFRRTSVAELKHLTLWNKNSQYCWLIEHMYEEFERFIFDAHELLLGESIPKPNLRSTLSFFSSKYPEVKKLESKNAFGIHLKIAVLMIEKLRHKIVHAQGYVNNLEQFVEKVISDSGVNNNKAEHREFIKQFVLDGRVYLLERPINDDAFLPRHIDVYTHMISYLAGYAGLVKSAVEPQ
ncbi:hypothetical protein BZG80_15485 [Salinivibrio sp. MA440]|uniref:hypothetical protein n=1 Tax=Salinivibrio sp. MA440 TaxID=1909456 RepID=UPI0009894E94|nr:hypothetical protein [Salinivibrio sp. MA440]OOF01546.1 hypothetical protein BZG80_15485 [Salinivibrio sp. MA440]